MKFPSFQSLIQKSTISFYRFPITIIAAAVASISLMYLIEHENDKTLEKILIKLVMSSVWLISLSFSFYVYSESKVYSTLKKNLLAIVSVVVAGLYFIFLPDEIEESDALLYVLLMLGSHLLVSFVAFVNKKSTADRFWDYNKNLFLTFIVSAIYSAVLFAGLAIALLSIDNLLEIDLGDSIYPKLWFLVAGLFNTWFFVSQVQIGFTSNDLTDSYPKGLKIFTQYILIPIITTYLLILYAYIFKIIVSSQWPVGWVSYLVLSFSIAGILALLLIWPTRNLSGNNWIHIYSRWFYLALLPLIVLLFFAIGLRIRDYGITEPRYFVLALAIWLLLNAMYYLFTRSKDIRIIPVSLFIFCMISAFGPWSAFNVSKRSQFNRLVGILQHYDMVDNGIIRSANNETEMSIEDEVQVSACVRYLVETHGVSSVQRLFEKDLLKETDSLQLKKHQLSEHIVQMAGLKYRYSQESESEITFISWKGNEKPIYPVNNFEEFSLFEMYEKDKGLWSDDYKTPYEVSYNPDNRILQFNNVINNNSIQFDLSDFINKNMLAGKFTIQTESPFVYTADIIVDVKLVRVGLTSIQGEVMDDNQIRINNINGCLLIGNKK